MVPDQVAQAVQGLLRGEKLKGLPGVRSNGVDEWTVLSGVVVLNGDELTPIVLTTGVKCLADEQMPPGAHGRLLHDCHAEVLALRALNYFLMRQCLDQSDEYLTMEGGRFRLKPGLQLALYISEPPCGDGSVDLLQLDEGDQHRQAWDRTTELFPNIVRGHESVFVTGKVRTKPGRKDSPVTLSKSCSDKLCLTQFKSVLNGLTSQFIDDVFLDYLVVPNSCLASMERCFSTRLNAQAQPGSQPGSQPRPQRSFQVLGTDVTIEKFTKPLSTSKAEPSPKSAIYIPRYNVNESVVNSVREGFHSKNKHKLRKNCESVLSRYSLFSLARPLLSSTDGKSYCQVKLQSVRYQENKSRGQRALGGWCHTAPDDFVCVW